MLVKHTLSSPSYLLLPLKGITKLGVLITLSLGTLFWNYSSFITSTLNTNNSVHVEDQRQITTVTSDNIHHNRALEIVVHNNDIDERCSFYLAESAIPNGGLAIFTTNDIKEGEPGQSMPDMCIYVADTPERTAFHTHSWNKRKFNGQFEGKNPRAACEGKATLPNSMPSKGNVRTSVLVAPIDHHSNGGLHRYKNPGAGAITSYYGITSKTMRNVSAGSEMTIEYGDWDHDESIDYVAPIRSVEWIRKYGRCVDNIEIKNATDTQMGRGAFAKRSLKKDTIVTGAPVQFYKDRSVFARQVPEALFVNYCYQPAGTKMLLYPYGPGVNVINHNHIEPNVKIIWSTHYMSHNPWLNLPLEQFWQMQYPGSIMFDYIALRDIKQGEELFIDYGIKWDNAWKQHVSNWKPYKNNTMSYTYIEEIDNKEPIRTVDEQKEKPYSSNLKTVCFTPNWRRDEYTTMKWTKPDYPYPNDLTYCNVLSRELNSITNEYIYNVSIMFDRLQPDELDQYKYIDTDIPHWAISFVDKPYMSDMHLPNAFRQPMDLPTNMIPKQWLKKGDNSNLRISSANKQ